jgi:CheY-like chemotaxis protein
MQRPRHGRVLVVDDDPDIRAFLQLALGAVGYDVRDAADGAAALAVLEGWRADAVLLDLMMPGCDGWEFRRRQRATPALADIPVILMTANRDLASAAAVLEPSGSLAKPFDVARLYELVGRCVAARAA